MTELGPNCPILSHPSLPQTKDAMPLWPNTWGLVIPAKENRKHCHIILHFAIVGCFPIISQALIPPPLHSSNLQYLSFLPHIPLLVLGARTSTCNNRPAILQYCIVTSRDEYYNEYYLSDATLLSKSNPPPQWHEYLAPEMTFLKKAVVGSQFLRQPKRLA